MRSICGVSIGTKPKSANVLRKVASARLARDHRGWCDVTEPAGHAGIDHVEGVLPGVEHSQTGGDLATDRDSSRNPIRNRCSMIATSPSIFQDQFLDRSRGMNSPAKTKEVTAKPDGSWTVTSSTAWGEFMRVKSKSLEGRLRPWRNPTWVRSCALGENYLTIV